jgi:hypothetical protein
MGTDMAGYSGTPLAMKLGVKGKIRAVGATPSGLELVTRTEAR